MKNPSGFQILETLFSTAFRNPHIRPAVSMFTVCGSVALRLSCQFDCLAVWLACDSVNLRLRQAVLAVHQLCR